MRAGALISFKTILFFLLASLAVNTAEAQLRKAQIVDERKAVARRSEKNVVLVDAQTIGALMAKCVDLGIRDVKLVFTRIRAIDMADYISNHPEAQGYEKDLLGKLTVLIKVEGDNITESDFVSDQGQAPANSLIEKMNSAGLKQVKKPYGGTPYTTKTLYFEVGSICPPPNSCD